MDGKKYNLSNRICNDAEKLIKKDKQELLHLLNKMGVKIITHPDGSRINLDNISLDVLNNIDKYISGRVSYYMLESYNVRNDLNIK